MVKGKAKKCMEKDIYYFKMVLYYKGNNRLINSTFKDGKVNGYGILVING